MTISVNYATHTDSLINLISTLDVYEDIKTNIARFYTSDYSENNMCGNVLLLEFVGLRAKMYACKFQDSNVKLNLTIQRMKPLEYR